MKTVFLTGATDGIGLSVAYKLVELGHRVLIHGRNPNKLADVAAQLNALAGAEVVGFCADLSDLKATERLCDDLSSQFPAIDILINNAGIYKTSEPITQDELDIRFVVNTLAPYLITQRLLPNLSGAGRVINLSSAAQSTVDLQVMQGQRHIDAFAAYAQSKLGIMMWSSQLARTLGQMGPMIISVNPGSLLASKMVKEGFGVAGKDINIGSNCVVNIALNDSFAAATGLYYDNDASQLTQPHPDALDEARCNTLIKTMDVMIERLLHGDQ